MNATGVAGNALGGAEDTVRDFWSSRPRRPRHGRKVAGVAEGIGNRYRIDPVIVRVALVVSTLFGGAGVLFYLLGWVFLPEEGDQVAPIEAVIGRGRSSTSAVVTVLLCVAMLPSLALMAGRGSGWLAFGGFSGFLSLLLLFAGVYLLHRSRGAYWRPEPVTYPAHAWSAAAPVDQEHSGWDPLAAAPLAWDLPDAQPPTEPPPPRPPREPCSKAGAVVFGLAALTAALCVGIAQFDDTFMTPAHIIGITLAVLGLGMVGAAFTNGGRGLVFPALALGVVGVLMTGQGGFDQWHGAGEATYRPTSISEVKPNYQRSVGTVYLDLRGLPNRDSVRTSLRNNVGEVVVWVPQDADVVATCAAKTGHVGCLGQTADGMGQELRVTDNGRDGDGGLRIELDATTTMGSVEVQRG